MIKKYRKLPIEVEAIQYRPDENLMETMGFVGKDGFRKELAGNKVLLIKNERHPELIVKPFEYILKDVFGQLSTLSNRVFSKLYGEITPEPEKKKK